jgi:hypothetical protein
MPFELRGPYALVMVKLLHTAVWIFFVGCILGITVSAAKGEFCWAATFTVTVLIECAILAFNGGRCPLTGIAQRFTDERRDNFDIYLPLWVARHNKTIFGTFFLLSEVYVLVLWVAYHH